MKLLAVLRRILQSTALDVLHDGVGLLFLLDSGCFEGLAQLEGVTQSHKSFPSSIVAIGEELPQAAQLVRRDTTSLTSLERDPSNYASEAR